MTNKIIIKNQKKIHQKQTIKLKIKNKQLQSNL